MPTIDALADELARLAAALREAGESGLRREMTTAIRKAAEPIPHAIRDGLKPHLPDRYAEVLGADLRLEVTVRTGATDPTVSIFASPVAKQRKLRKLESGLLSHPVFGDRKVWRTQDVKPGWFSQPCQDAAPRVREEIAAALDRVGEIIWARTRG